MSDNSSQGDSNNTHTAPAPFTRGNARVEESDLVSTGSTPPPPYVTRGTPLATSRGNFNLPSYESPSNTGGGALPPSDSGPSVKTASSGWSLPSGGVCRVRGAASYSHL